VRCAPAGARARRADAGLLFPEAAEESLVMTRSFTTMLLGLMRWGGLEVGGAPVAGAALLARLEADAHFARLAGAERFRSLLYLGAGPRYGLALEGALKVGEMSLTPAVAFHPLELRHGPIALVGEGTLAVLLIGEADRSASGALAEEIEARGAIVLRLEEELPAAALPLQLLGYHRALARGIDCDAPPTLSRYVRLDLEDDRG
jgi:glucosamine--fructose-6-phosphate aminotransferase (isomerizing)